MGAGKQPDDRIQSQGRKDNAAQHLNAAPDNAGAERYPSTNRDDSIDTTVARGERRASEGARNPRPRQGAGDGGPDPSVNQGRVDAADDAAEDRR